MRRHVWTGVFFFTLMAGATWLGAAQTGTLIIEPDLRAPGTTSAGEKTLYIAAVSESEPWREPARETTVEQADLPIRWRLPAGRYRVMAGAVGFSLSYGPAIEVATGGVVRAEPALRPLDWVEGRVLAADGRPIADARIGRLRAWLASFARQLSILGEKHLTKNFAATTDSDGRFRLPMLPEAGHVLWVEAPGFAPRFLPDVRVPRDLRSLAHLTLDPGASLVAVWPEGRPELDDRYRLELKPAVADQNPVEGIDRRGLAALWERLPGADRVTWSSLPRGQFEIVLRGTRRGAHTITPRPLASVRLAIGDDVEVVLDTQSIPASTSVVTNLRTGTSPSGDDKKLSLMSDLDASGLDHLAVFRWQRGRPPEPVRVLRTVAASSGKLRIDLATGCGRDVRFSVEGAEVVGASAWQEPPCNSAIGIALLPAATVTGRLAMPAGHERSAVGELVARDCAEGSQRALERQPAPGSVAIPFVLDRDSRFSTRVPAQCSEVLIRVGDLALASLPLAEIAVGEASNVGTISMREGASALVRVVSEDDGFPLAGARVSTLPARDSARRHVRPENAHALIHEPSAIAGEDGWVRLFGIPAGDSVFVVSREDVVFPHLSDPYRFLGRDELVIDPLAVPSPAQLEVEVAFDGSLSGLAGRGVYEITVVASRADSAVAPLRVSVPAVSGTAVFDQLAVGAWQLEALLRLGADQPMIVVGNQQVAVLPGVNLARLEIAEALFEGRVTYRGDPVVGEVSFRPAKIGRARHHKNRTRLDRDGNFQIPLEPGAYDVEVWDHEGVFRGAIVSGIELIEPDRFVEIEVPTGAIAGIVIDDDGLRVEGARVTAFRLEDDESDAPATILRKETSGPDGFQFEGLSEGMWTLWAKVGDGRSSYSEVEVAARARVDGVRLTIRKNHVVRLFLYDSQGSPISDASGYLTLRPSFGTYGSVSKLEMGRDGGYSVEIPEERVDQANLVVRSSQGTDALVTPIEEPQAIHLSGPGAHVFIGYDTARWERRFGNYLFLVRPNGAFVNLGDFTRSSNIDQEGRRTIEINSLGSGRWSVVGTASAAEIALVNKGYSMLVPVLASFESQAGNVIEIDLSESTARNSTEANLEGEEER